MNSSANVVFYLTIHLHNSFIFSSAILSVSREEKNPLDVK